MSAAAAVPTPADSLADLIVACHNARGGHQEFATRLAAAKERFADQYRELIDLTEQSRGLVETLERRIRIAAVEEFERTGSKAPVPGVEIRTEKVLVYDQDTATAWAKETGMALTLDVAAFEKIALATPIAGVIVQPQPKARIARDLTEAAALLAYEPGQRG